MPRIGEIVDLIMHVEIGGRAETRHRVLLALCGLLLRQRDRDLVEADGIVEDELVERRLAERRLGRGVALGFRVGPRAVEAGEIAGPQEIAKTDFRDAAEAALLLDLEGEKDLTTDKLARTSAELDIGAE